MRDLSHLAYRLHITAMLHRGEVGWFGPIPNRHPEKLIPGITEEEYAAATTELVERGFWEWDECANGWLITFGIRRCEERELPQCGSQYRGSYPFAPGENIPADGTPVVYMLGISDRVPSLQYIGSTSNLRSRLASHAADGKAFDGWSAKAYATRELAYVQEKHMIGRHKPPLNVTWMPPHW
jgi:hypothetical protein